MICPYSIPQIITFSMHLVIRGTFISSVNLFFPTNVVFSQSNFPYDEIRTLCASSDMRKHLLAKGITEKLCAFFPTSDKKRRWEFERFGPPSYHDSVRAIDVLEELKVLSWETAIQRLLIRFKILF